MTRRHVLAALALATPLLLAGCADTCTSSEAAVKDGQTPVCVGGVTDVTVRLTLCADCTKTSPACSVDYTYLSAKVVQLNTTWQLCDANKGCGIATGCDYVVCNITVPASDVYTVDVLRQNGSGAPTQDTFTLDTTGATPACTALPAAI